MGNEQARPALGTMKRNSSKDILVETAGKVDTFDFRVFALTKNDAHKQATVSMWHDIPLYPEVGDKEKKIVNMICEIPRCSRKKYEIATNEPGNPIKQDVKKGKLREFSKGDLYFNYGCIPRTWEDPDKMHPDAGAVGDNDPLDVCEIGLRIMGVAEVCAVKVLGTLCLIDEGEADWKLIAIDVNDPWASLLNDVTDVEEKLPGFISAIREWFRTYKIPDGKPPNEFALNEECMNAAYAMSVIDETHHSWKELVSGEKDFIPSEKPDGVSEAETAPKMKRNLSYPKLSSDDLTKLVS